jgi:4-amino-4-deoxy-L-arabinose transferase-like glycosyltransferase
LGFACGFIAITHAEQLLLVVVLLVPLVLLARGVARRQRVAWVALAVAAAAVMIVPWAAYNTSRFHTPVLLGNELGITLTVSNCDDTYQGANVGFQDLRCQTAATQAGLIKGEDEATRDDQYTHVGLDYVRAHLSRLPAVIAFREARTWGLYPRQLHFDTGRNTSYTIIELGFAAYWMLVPAGIFGAVVLRRRRVTILPLYGFFLAVAASTAITYGFTRFRAPAEVPIVLLAAVGIDAVRRRLSRWMASGERVATPPPDSADTPEPAPVSA